LKLQGPTGLICDFQEMEELLILCHLQNAFPMQAFRNKSPVYIFVSVVSQGLGELSAS